MNAICCGPGSSHFRSACQLCIASHWATGMARSREYSAPTPHALLQPALRRLSGFSSPAARTFICVLHGILSMSSSFVRRHAAVLRMTHEFNHPHARPASDFIVTPCADSRLVDPRVQCRPSARICDQTARPLEFGSSPENTCTHRRRLARARAVNVTVTSRADPRP